MHLPAIWTWGAALVSVFLWALGIYWFLRVTGRDRKSGADELASKEAYVMAWSEARTLEVMERFPHAATPALVYAGHAMDRKDYEEALRRYQEAINRDPWDIRGYLFSGHRLREFGRLDEAEALLRRARRRFRSDVRVYEDVARIAEMRPDWPEAARRWAVVRKRFPAQPSGWRGGAAALRKAGRIVEADALFAEAEARFPAPAPAPAQNVGAT